MRDFCRSVLLSLLLTIPASAATVTIEKLWLRTGAGGDPVPGRPFPVVFRELTGTDNSSRPVMLPPVINSVGQVVFRARSASQNDNNALNAVGIYAKQPLAAMIRLVDTTEVSPGVPTFAVPGRPSNTRFTDFKAPLINDVGDVVFFARFQQPGNPAGSGAGFYATRVTGGSIVKLADTFTTVPGHPTAIFRTFDFVISQMLTVALNNNGGVVYWGDWLIPPAVFPNMKNGIFGTTVVGGAGTLLCDSTQNPVFTPVGMIAPFGSFSEVRPTLAINNNTPGIVAFKGNLGPPSTFSTGGVFAVAVSGGPIQAVATAFQQAPGRTSPVTFGGSFGPSDDTLDINNAGTVVFQNNFFPSFNELGHYAGRATGGPHTRIADGFGCNFGPCLPIPAWPFPSLETVPPAEFAIGSFPNINEAGQYGDYVRVINTSVPNQQGIYANDPSGFSITKVVANLSTPPPGLPAPVGGFPRFTNGGFTAESATLNDQGHMTFAAGGSLTTTTNFLGLYFYDSCTPELARISDSTIALGQLGSGFSGSNQRYDMWQVEGRNGHLKSIANNNDVVFAVAFNNLDSGMFIAHITTGSGGQLNIICPPNVTAQCPANTDPAATGTATATGCGTITISHSNTSATTCGNASTITRTWTANNGSTTASCMQTINVIDTTGPALSGVPNNATVQCNALPPAASVTALDACQGNIPVTLTDTRVAGLCPGTYVLTRTWTATDGCGNSTSASQDVSVMDTIAPVLVGVPTDVSAECDAVPLPATVTASDTCAVTVPVTFVETQTNGTCPDEYTLTRSWTAVDNCSNNVTARQFVSVDDTTRPMVTCPAHATLECPANISVLANGTASATDNCSTPTVGSSDAVVAGCGTTQTITRTWTAADECANSKSCGQLIAVVDTAAPAITLNTTPILVTDTDCSGSETVALPTGTANDVCDGPRPVTHDAPSTFPAGQTTTVTYAALDACGNAASAQVNVNVLFGSNIAIRAEKHTVGTGPHPGSIKEPLVGILVCAYDKSVGSCARTVCGGISHQHYQCILDMCTPTGCGTTNSFGEVTLNLPPGDYIVVSGDATKTVLPDPLGVSASDLMCGQTMQKYLQQVIRADGSKKSAKYTVLTGSQLLIIEPEFIVWDNTQQLYPFVFETIGDWIVTATVAPPVGFVADYNTLTAEVVNAVKSVQFTITEVGSDLVPTQTTFEVLHKGEHKTVRSSVDIRLTPDYARSRGFDVDKLRTKGLIVEPVERQSAKSNRESSR